MAEWHITPITITSLFAVYPSTLVVVLIVFGGISDFAGRRAALLAGLVAMTLGILLFARAPSVEWLYAGRALQGIGVGLAIAPASAAMVEFSPSGVSSRASSINTAATGLALATVFAMGAMFLSLGSSIAKNLIGTDNALVAGSVIAISAVLIGTSAILGRRLDPRTAVAIGGVCIAIGMGMVVVSAAYLVAYLTQGLVAEAIGLSATITGLALAVDLWSPIIAALSLAASVVALVTLRPARVAVPA